MTGQGLFDGLQVVQTGQEWRFFVGEDITLGKDTVEPGKTPKEVDSYYINGPARLSQSTRSPFSYGTNLYPAP